MKAKIVRYALGFTALTAAQAASAQQQACVEPADVADTVVYAIPMLYDAIQGPCSSTFAQSAFMTNDAAAFVDTFRAQQDGSWSGTLRLIKVFAAASVQKDGDDNAMAQALAMMPEDALRPLADVLIDQMLNERIADNIKVSTCSDIAEAMELVAPLPPENIAGLAAFIAKRADLEDPKVCGVPEAVQSEAATSAE